MELKSFQVRVGQRAAVLAAADDPRQLALRHQVPAAPLRGLAVGHQVPARLEL